MALKEKVVKGDRKTDIKSDKTFSVKSKEIVTKDGKEKMSKSPCYDHGLTHGYDRILSDHDAIGIIYISHTDPLIEFQRNFLKLDYDALGFYYWSDVSSNVRVSYYELFVNEKMKFVLIDIALISLLSSDKIESIKIRAACKMKSFLKQLILEQFNSEITDWTLLDLLNQETHPVIKTIKVIMEKIGEHHFFHDVLKDKIQINEEDGKIKLYNFLKEFREGLITGPGVLDVNELLKQFNEISDLPKIDYVPGDDVRECLLSIHNIEPVKIKLGSKNLVYQGMKSLEALTKKELFEILEIIDEKMEIKSDKKERTYLSLRSDIGKLLSKI